jgi:phosphatidylglycerol:prolipoprotein diacylglycerol transferase
VAPGVIEIFPPAGLGLGPLFVGFYGLGYVVGLGVLLWVSQAEARHRGYDPSQVTGALLLVAACALVGARLYHVIDQWAIYQPDPIRIVLPPYSGLGLYGGIFGAAIGIWVYTRRRGLPTWTALDVVVPGTFFAQAIARWGNFFNQELYGPPTELPWGITIDCAHRIAPYPCDTFPATTTGFHPLFVYESILDLAGGLIALWLSRRHLDQLRDGDLASFWMIWYGGGRLLLETFRSGWNWTLGGLPTATLIGAVLVAAGIATIVARHRRPDPPAVEPV